VGKSGNREPATLTGGGRVREPQSVNGNWYETEPWDEVGIRGVKF